MTKLYCPDCKKEVLETVRFAAPSAELWEIRWCRNCSGKARKYFAACRPPFEKGRPVFEIDCLTEEQLNSNTGIPASEYLAKLHAEREKFIKLVKRGHIIPILSQMEGKITGLSFAINTFEQLFGNSEELKTDSDNPYRIYHPFVEGQYRPGPLQENENKVSQNPKNEMQTDFSLMRETLKEVSKIMSETTDDLKKKYPELLVDDWISFADRKPKFGQRIEFESFDIDEETGQETLACLGTDNYDRFNPYHRKIKRWKPAHADDIHVVESKENLADLIINSPMMGLDLSSGNDISYLDEKLIRLECEIMRLKTPSQSQIAIDKVVEALEYYLECWPNRQRLLGLPLNIKERELERAFKWIKNKLKELNHE